MDTRVRAAVPIIGVTEFEKVLRADDQDYPQAAYIEELKPALKEFARQHCDARLDSACMVHVWRRLLPEFLEDPDFACGGLVQLIAPRPLMIISHDRDQYFPVVGARAVAASARARYELLAPGQADLLFQYREFHGVHGVAQIKGIGSLGRMFRSGQRMQRDVELGGKFIMKWLKRPPSGDNQPASPAGKTRD